MSDDRPARSACFAPRPPPIARTILAFAAISLLSGAALPISFIPARPHFAQGAADYARIWRSDGVRIVAALEAATRLDFPDNAIDAIVSEGRPMMSFDGRS